MNVDTIAWRVERACMAAYPPRVTQRVGGWQVARSGGGSRRSNAASATKAEATFDAATLATIAALYDGDGQPTIMRVTDLTPAVSSVLNDAGFGTAEGHTRTLLRRLRPGSSRDGNVIVRTTADPAWLAARRRLGGNIEDPALVAARISVPVAYARLGDGGVTEAMGYVAVHDRIAVLEAIATDLNARRRGHARAVVGALLDWAAAQGAEYAALQVEEANVAARALYVGMGFATDLYGYHYRRRAASLDHAARVGSPRS